MKVAQSCRLCGATSLLVSYDGPMRHSGVGKDLCNVFRILRCECCNVEFIDPFSEESQDVYKNGSYWNRKGGRSNVDIDLLHSKALEENLLWLEKIGTANLAGKCVLDFGCGSGAFLDLIKGVAGATIGIERDGVLAAYARKRGHLVFCSIEELLAAGIKTDILVSFDVFEHLTEPLTVLKSLKNVFVSGGLLYVGVPNQLDKIKALVPAYLPHFYHVEHKWYFDAHSMRHLFEQAGCHIDALRYLHKYNFMNLIEWARTGKAPGNPHCDAVDDDLDNRIRGWLEDRGAASHLLLETSFAQ